MMKPKTQRTVAGLAVGALLLLWFGVALLLFYVPRLAVCWAETGAELSPAKKILVQLGNSVSGSFFGIGLLFVVTLAAVAWRVAAARRAARTRTG
jgi:type II secretory pathway component PulF